MKTKITKVNASFSLKKNLGQFENADIWFSAEAQVGARENPEKVAEAVKDFCKRLAVKEYNSFSRRDLTIDSSEPMLPKQPEPVKPRPGEIEKILGLVYMATDRQGTKKVVNKKENTLEPQ